MKNKNNMPIIIGPLLILLTLVVFLVPNMDRTIEAVIYVRMFAVIVSIIICTLALKYLSDKKGLFLFSGFSGAISLYFILNLIGVLVLNSIPLILTIHLSLNILLLIIFILLARSDVYVHRNKGKEEKDYSKPKSGSSY